VKLDEQPTFENLRPEEFYRLLVHETRELLCLHSMDGKFRYANPASIATVGFEPDELVGMDPYDLVHPHDAASLRASHASVLRGEDPPALTCRFRRKDGSYTWLETRAHPIRTRDQRTLGLISSSRDVSRRVELMDRVAEREATLRSILGSFDDLVFVFDRDGVFIQYYQPNARTDLYRPPENFVGEHFSKVLPPQVAAPLAAALREIVEGEPLAQFDYELTIRGEPRHFGAKLSPLLDGVGALRGSVAVVREITERMIAEESRLALIRTRDRSDRLEALAYLAAGTAHQFNNLLTVIQGNLHMAREAAEDASVSELRSELDGALQAAGRAADLTRRLLNSAGRFGGPMESLDLRAMVESHRESWESLLPEGIPLRAELHEEVPRVLADRSRVREAVEHLVLNAGEAIGDDGEVVIRVESRTFMAEELMPNRTGPEAEPGEYVVMEVSDSGEGMTPELLARAFEPFFTTRFVGRGLGLSEVAGTMRRHQGAVLVDSVPNHGTTIRLLFPVADGD
jgi:two-component system, cell cycle sensor histidine kinase and response regulator CckA